MPSILIRIAIPKSLPAGSRRVPDDRGGICAGMGLRGIRRGCGSMGIVVSVCGRGVSALTLDLSIRDQERT